jgi:anti-sigma-K factor RskA
MLTAAVDTGRRSLVVSPAVVNAPAAGQVPELWLIPADGKPRSLGVIGLEASQLVEVPPMVLKLVAEGAVLAVSIEPTGGSPTGQPTGPVVATGKLVTL